MTAPSRFGCLMAYLPEDECRPIERMLAQVPDQILAEDGREHEPHVTVLFGFTDPDPVPHLRQFLNGWGPVSFTLGATSRFRNASQDVLKIDIEGDELHALRNALVREFDHVLDFPVYHPHMTIAYLLPGTGLEFDGFKGLAGRTVTVGNLRFSDRNRVHTVLPLGNPGGVSDPALAMMGVA